jgi:16S rRNA (uracil1498-N3)-methyltransferase
LVNKHPYNTTMNFSRFFCPVHLSSGLRVNLPEGAARHACRVLRLRVGDELVLFNGTGGEYFGRITSVERERVEVEVLKWHERECEAPIRVTLVQAVQAGEKMDMTVQKAVELGVARIVPVSSRRGVVRLEGERAMRRVEHWRAVSIAACEQCGRNRVPEVLDLGGLGRWLAEPAAPDVRRLVLSPGAQMTLGDVAPPRPGEGVELLIGAEGGLAPDELALAEGAGYLPVSLGPRILRTETAGLAALAVIQCLWGDFRGVAAHV